MGSGGGKRERGRGRLGDANRQAVRDDSFVSPWAKWLMFSFNMFFWLVSCVLIGIGIYAYFATQEYKVQSETFDVSDILFDVSIVFIFFGCLVFLLAFMGAIGSLRENTCLLKTFAICLGILFLIEVGLAIACFALADPIINELSEILQDKAIREYRDDINRNNIIDWFQEERMGQIKCKDKYIQSVEEVEELINTSTKLFKCCGVGASVDSNGYTDWESNKYFNCSSPGFEACSVPYSCCQDPYTFDEAVVNTRCGADVLSQSRTKASETVWVTGCITAVQNSAKENMFILGGIAIAVVIPQLVGIFLARVLAGQIEDQKARWGGH